MPINKNGNSIFGRKRYAKTEYAISTDIEVHRHTDGSVRVVIGSHTECTDRSIKTYKLSSDDAAQLGRVLLCIPDDTFDAIIARSDRKV